MTGSADLLSRDLPWIVGADAPEMPLKVATGEGSATVIHIADVENHLGAGGFGSGVDGIGVIDDKAGSLCLAKPDLVGLDCVFAVLGAIRRRAEHNHSIAEGELSMHDSGVIRAEIDGLFFETEGADEPVDSAERVAVTDRRDDSGAAGFSWGHHGFKNVRRWREMSWKNRRESVAHLELEADESRGMWLAQRRSVVE